MRFPEIQYSAYSALSAQRLFGTFAFAGGTSLHRMHVTEACHLVFEFPGTVPATGPFLVLIHCRHDSFGFQFWITSGPGDPGTLS